MNPVSHSEKLMIASSLIQTAMDSLDQDRQAHQIVTIMRALDMISDVVMKIDEADESQSQQNL